MFNCLNLLLCSGYILTAPNVFFPGRAESVCVTFHDLKSDNEVTVNINITVHIPKYYYSSNEENNHLNGTSIANFAMTVKPSENGE